MEKNTDPILKVAVNLLRTGDLDKAEEVSQKALNELPHNAHAFYVRGLVAMGRGQINQAIKLFYKSIEIKPDEAIFHCNLGTALARQGRTIDSIKCFEKATVIKPNLAAGYYNCGNAFQLLGRYAEAEASYREALRLKPLHIETLNNLGNLLQENGRLAEAHKCFESALRYAPDSPELHVNVGNTLRNKGAYKEAIAAYRRALELRPNYCEAQSCLLFALSTYEGCSTVEYLREAERYGSMVTARVKEKFKHKPLKSVGVARRLRVGFVSGDFRLHPVGYFLENVIKQLNSERIELFSYCTRLYRDELTDRIGPYFSEWRSIVNFSDEEAANLINQDRIDVLFDLSGHTSGNRLALFAWKPAPIQVSWLGYFASTGVAEIDYILADYVSVPNKENNQFTEAVWRLRRSRLCFSAPTEYIPISNSPSLQNGFITFGCQQSLSKLTDNVLTAWGRIFKELPGARLRLQSKQLRCDEVSQNLVKRLSNAGITPDKIELLGPLNRIDYLRGYERIDVALDTFPYPGGTTTCEALWMGVPTLTLSGKTMLSRQGASLMIAAGLDEFVARSLEEYIEKAINIGKDPTQLYSLRSALRSKVHHSELFDSFSFAQEFGESICRMYDDAVKLTCPH